MASPPGSFSSLPNPKKRASMSSQLSNAKRPKVHPLRQTSFVAPNVNDSAVHSARSETGSMVSATSSRMPGRGRGRPRKSLPAQAINANENKSTAGDGGSQVGGTKGGRGGAKSVVSGRGEGDDEQDDEDDDENENEGEEMLEGEDEVALRRAEGERQQRLMGAFDDDQISRYSEFRKFTLPKKDVRRIINQVMSQSSTDKVVETVRWTGKLFVGILIEGARDVQREYAQAYERTREAEAHWRLAELARLKARKEAGGMSEDQEALVDRDITRLGKEKDMYIPNPHRGGLLPDHLREALRRYQADGESGGAGFQGSSHNLLGVPGSAPYRVGSGVGRRLFR
jgi:transcription initiation factor TFIID subunit 11